MSRSIYLASGSPRRRELLAGLGVDFEVVPPTGVDETAVGGSAFVLCQELARRKSEWVLARLEEAGLAQASSRVLGCDTVVALIRGGRERVLGKPASRDEARRTLRLLSGCTHRVLSGVAVAKPGYSTRVELEVSHVTFRSLTEDAIEAYVATGDADDKAGAYGIQTAGDELVESIKGCYFNVVGLPVSLVARMLDLDFPECECPRHPLQRGARGCEISPSDETTPTA